MILYIRLMKGFLEKHLLCLENGVQGIDVLLSHLKGFKLGELPLGSDSRDHLTKTIKGHVETVHPSSFPGIGSQSSLLHDVGIHFLL